MYQRGVAQILILGILGLFIVVGSALYFMKFSNMSADLKTTQENIAPSSTHSPKIQPVNTQTTIVKIHLADDRNISIEEIRLVEVIIRPTDVIKNQDGEWMSVAETWESKQLEGLAKFWENILDNRTKITYQFYPRILAGTRKVSEYDFNSIYEETMRYLQQDTDFKPYFNKQTDEFLILNIFILIDDDHYYKYYSTPQGSHFGNIGVVIRARHTVWFYKFISEDIANNKEATYDPTGAHEMGHALGLQHSGDDPNIRAKYLKGDTWTSNCYDLMLGHTFQQETNLDTGCILPEQKQLFFK